MKRLVLAMVCLICLIGAALAETPAPPATDVVLDWNLTLLKAVQKNVLIDAPTFGSRAKAIVHVAIFDAVNAIVPQRQPYALRNYTAPEGASVEAAATQAAFVTLSYLFPQQRPVFEAERQRWLAKVPNEQAKLRGIAVGNAAAWAIIALRYNDGAYRQVDYQPKHKPGYWRYTPPDYSPPLDPQWPYVTPFVLQRADQYRPDGPPALSSLVYAAAWAQIKLLGAANSPVRTREQTLIGVFWSYDQDPTAPSTVLYNQVVRRIAIQKGNTVVQNAYLFALVNLGMADAAIACWDAKYYYDFWRPVTAIRLADQDYNPLTHPDRNWLPLGGTPYKGPIKNFTPNHPSYPSGHASQGETLFRLLERYYGTPWIRFTLESEELPGYSRTFVNLQQASSENAYSRVYLGVHWIFDCTAGMTLGRQLADYVYPNVMQPLPAKP